MNNNINNCKCEQCGKNIHKYPSEIKENNFCNRECYAKWSKGRKKNKNNCVCPICEKEFYRKPSYLKKLKRKPTCGFECKGKLQTKIKYEKMSEMVSEDFKEYLKREYWENQKNTREISIEVYGKPNKTLIIDYMKLLDIPRRNRSESVALQWVDNDERKKQAAEIILEVRQRPEVIKKINDYRQTDEFKGKISKANIGENNGMFGRTGKKSPRWNPEYDSSLNKLYRKDLETVRWRKKVFDRDEYKCKICGEDKGGNLNAHHLDGWDEHIDKRYDEGNGITLCNKCHRDFHNIYGYGKNTKEQFIQYKVNRASNK